MTASPPPYGTRPQRGTMPVLQFCSPSQLMVDRSYQRATDAQPSRRLIGAIARDWDWGLYQPLVVARRADGGLYVVDGQHRLEAARMRGDIQQLPCVITAYDTARDEAAAFVSINQQRRPLTPLNLFRAAVAAGEDDALIIAGIIERAGLTLTAGADQAMWKPGWINNIQGIRQCFRQHGERALRLSLEALAQGFDGQVLRYCGTVFGAIYPAVAAAGTQFVPFVMLEILRDATQEHWMARFREEASQRQCSVGVAARELIGTAYGEATAE